MRERFIRLLSKLNRSEDMSIREQKELIDSFPEPRNDVDRTYYQYRCVFAGKSRASIVVLEAAGILMCIPALAAYLVNRIRYGSRKKEQKDIVFLNTKNKYGMTYKYSVFIPPRYLQNRESMEVFEYEKYPPLFWGRFGRKAFRTWAGLALRHPLRGYMNFNCLMHLMSLNRICWEYSPKEILCYRAEGKYESSVLASFCESQGVEYNNFMHGELLLSKKRAFVRFTRLYLWDEHYKEIFRWGRSDERQYCIYCPGILNRDYRDSAEPPFYLTYYLSGGSDETKYHENVPEIAEILKRLQRSGKRCKVRPHPRWSDMDAVRACCGGEIPIEIPSEVGLDDSIRQSAYVAGTMSTCLLQAFSGGKPVILDDVTAPGYFQRMRESRFILMNKPHLCLSELPEGR